VYLLELALASGTLYLCDAIANITFPTAGTLYYAWRFSFDSIKNHITGEVDRVSFSFDNTDLTFRAYTDTDAFQGCRLTLRLIFADLLSSADYQMVLFTGLMSAPVINEETVDIEVSSPLIRLGGTIPRRRYQNNCHWKFADTNCTAGMNAGQIVTLIGAVNGTADSGTTTTLVDAALTEADDYWRYGTVEFTSGDNDGEIRTVTDFVASTDTVTLSYALPHAVVAGDGYTIKKGCNKTSAWCSVHHNNWANFGGFVGLPQRSK
jgi:uncharacterized phage protein (TIGR02218 family)